MDTERWGLVVGALVSRVALGRLDEESGRRDRVMVREGRRRRSEGVRRVLRGGIVFN